MRWVRLAVVLAIAMAASSAATPVDRNAGVASLNDRLSGDITPVHDPAIIRAGPNYYVFSTSQLKEGRGLIHIRLSRNLANWAFSGSVFRSIPAWAQQAVPGTQGIWAPDISYVSGRYRLYYAVSTFGSNRSVIGLATAATLDPSSPDYGWRDEGEVIRSDKGNDYNAIDPNFVVDAGGGQWLAFGSFWSGIKLVRLDPATGKPTASDKTVYSLAERPRSARVDAIEAPFILQHGRNYYLFVSFDFCCRGANSSYYTVVGRSKEVTGPYVGRDGRKMKDGGGFLVLDAQLDPTNRWRGPGGASILRDGDREFIVYHAYDAKNKGVPTLRIQAIGWMKDGWPVAL